MKVLQNILFVIQGTPNLANKLRNLALVALMAALANILSAPPFAIPIGPRPALHFTQFPILLVAMLAGPVAGLMTGAIGGLLSSFVVVPEIPFIAGGLAILGCAAGFLGKKLRPLYAGILAWVVQAPYLVITDYAWFTIFAPGMSQGALWVFIGTVLLLFTFEVLVSLVLAEVVIGYMKKAGIAL